MKKNTKSGTRPQEIPRGSLHMRHKPAPKILQGNALEVPKESVSVITLTEEVPASLIDWHCCCSVTKSCLTLCDLIGLQQARLPCPSSPRACSNSCPLSWWCHPTISSSVVPFSFCPQSFPASGSFPMSQLFTSGGQSIGVSVSVFDWHCE